MCVFDNVKGFNIEKFDITSAATNGGCGDGSQCRLDKKLTYEWYSGDIFIRSI